VPRRLAIGILAGSILFLVGGCNDCPECPPEDHPYINGLYWGSYEFMEIHSGVDTIRSLGQPVSVKFKASSFSIQLTPGVDDSLRIVCDMFGDYSLSRGITLDCWSVDSTDACAEPLLYPCGYFVLNQTTDTLRLTRDTTTADTVRYIKKLVLLPVQ